jgi:hypothetical protein
MYKNEHKIIRKKYVKDEEFVTNVDTLKIVYPRSTELWRDVVGYEGLYMVSTFGRVKGYPRKGCQGRILKNGLNEKGYPCVNLSRAGEKYHRVRVHRLVAMAFIPNPNNLPFVNHRDENPANSEVWNLEWCTQMYNMNYGTIRDRCYKTPGKRVQQYDLNGVLLATYENAYIASRITGIQHSHIRECCNGGTFVYKKGKRWKNIFSAGGYVWKEID